MMMKAVFVGIAATALLAAMPRPTKEPLAYEVYNPPYTMTYGGNNIPLHCMVREEGFAYLASLAGGDGEIEFLDVREGYYIFATYGMVTGIMIPFLVPMHTNNVVCILNVDLI
jgi:hypothetical protein